MKCPACKRPLREKGAGSMTLDICYGGCGGIWFDAGEFSRIYDEIKGAKVAPPSWASAMAAAAAHVEKKLGDAGQPSDA
jgi:Zn-finger nucleic acid-binding protein